MQRVSLWDICETAGLREVIAQRSEEYSYDVWAENSRFEFTLNDNEGRAEGAD